MPDLAQAASKLARIREELNRRFVERADLIDGALVALLSHSHILIIGPPGTAKSMLADELCRRIEGANYFQWLLTKFTTPEEVFGAVSLAGLEHDDYRRVTTHKLPEAHISFLDEIFKSNSSILNALLTIVNERIFHNGRERTSVPLLTMFGASNELPDEDELAALYDRFMLRFVVDYVTEEHHFLRMISATEPAGRTTLTLEELALLSRAAAGVGIGGVVLDIIAQMRKRLHASQITVSDRRWKNSLAIIRAHATLCGRTTASEDDVMFLRHVLWSDPEERPKVAEALGAVVRGYETKARELLFESRELRDYAEGEWESEEQRMRALTEVTAKMAKITAEFDAIVAEAAENGRTVDTGGAMREELRGIKSAMIRRAIG